MRSLPREPPAPIITSGVSCVLNFMLFLMSYITHERQCFIGISKHREESQTYNAQRNIFDEIRVVWIVNETLSWVFDICSQSKQKLRSKRRSKTLQNPLQSRLGIQTSCRIVDLCSHTNSSVHLFVQYSCFNRFLSREFCNRISAFFRAR